MTLRLALVITMCYAETIAGIDTANLRKPSVARSEAASGRTRRGGEAHPSTMETVARHTPARKLGDATRVGGIECLSLKRQARMKGVDAFVAKMPGIYMVAGEVGGEVFCYIGRSVKLGQRPFSHLEKNESFVNERFRKFIHEHTTSEKHGADYLTVYCLETHDLSGLNKHESDIYQWEREVFYYRKALRLLGDAWMLNEKEPVLVGDRRSKPVQQKTNERTFHWSSVKEMSAHTGIEVGTIYRACMKKGSGKIFGQEVSYIPRIDPACVYDPAKHTPAMVQPPPEGRPEKPIRQWLPNGTAIDWPSLSECVRKTTIANVTIRTALKTDGGKLFGFRFKRILAVEADKAYDEKKHKPEMFQPPPGRRSSEAQPIRQRLPSGGVIDWPTARFCAKTTTIAPGTLRDTLNSDDDKLFGFRFKRIPVVNPDNAYDPKKHKPEMFMPPPGQRSNEAHPIRQHLPNGGIIDWPTQNMCDRATGISDEAIQAAIDKKGGKLFVFRFQRIDKVNPKYEYDPKKHKPEMFQPTPGQRRNEATPIRQRLPNGDFIDWTTAAECVRKTTVERRELRTALDSDDGKLFGFRFRRIPEVNPKYEYDEKRHRPEMFQARKVVAPEPAKNSAEPCLSLAGRGASCPNRSKSQILR